MQDVLGLILGGGRGAQLYPLTKQRSEPAVPLAGKYRLIDIPVSNCINSGINRVYVLTQFLSVSLHRHIGNTYSFDPFGHGFVEILAAQQTNETADWYRGIADAVRQNLRYVHSDPCTDVLILYGDQLYRMDFRELVRTHRDARADVTLAVKPVGADRAPGFGIVQTDEGGRVVAMTEKPAPDRLPALRTSAAWLDARGIRSRGREYLANMGIYLIRREVLFELLNAAPSANDLATEILAGALGTYRFQAHPFDGFWEDLGSIRSYHAVHLTLAGSEPPFDFNSPQGVIYTHMRHLPASRVSAAEVDGCLLSDGCVIERGSRLERSVVGVRTRIGRNVTVRDAILLGANYYDGQGAPPVAGTAPPLGVGDDSVLECVIVDKNCRIGRGVRITNQARVQRADGPNHVIRDGIVVLPNGAVVPDGTVI